MSGAVGTVSAVRPSTNSRSARSLAALERELPTLLATADFSGLLRLQALAQVLAQQTEGNLHRRAARIAKKAGAAAAKAPKLDEATAPGQSRNRQTSVEPTLGRGRRDEAEFDRSDRNGRVVPLASPPAERAAGNGSSLAPPAGSGRAGTGPELDRSLLAHAATPRTPERVAGGPGPAATSADGRLLFARLATLLRILARDEEPPDPVAPAALRELVVRRETGVVDVALPAGWGSYWQLLLSGYEQARVLPGKLVFGVLRRQHQRQIRRELKQIAVDSLSSGTDVRGLTIDAVPAVAYALLIGRLPTSVEDGSPEAAERVNDVFLSVSHNSAGLPPETSSPVFLDLFKLSVALGEAERYAAQLSLVGLQGGGAEHRSRPSGRTLGVALVLGAGALVAALAGLAIGMSGSHGVTGKRAALGRTTTTVARTTTVTRIETITRQIGPKTSAPARATPVPQHQAASRASAVPRVTTVTVTTAAQAGQAPARTVTVTTPAQAVKAPVPAVRVRDVVPAGCASAVAAAKSIALLAANSFGLFADYASLASDAVPAAVNHDAAKMGSISNKTNSISASLKAEAAQIARLANAVSAGVGGCQ